MKLVTRINKTPPTPGETLVQYMYRMRLAHNGIVSEEQLRELSLVHFASNNPSRVLVIPDIHAPAVHPLALDFLKWVCDEYKCDTVLSIGDIADLHSITFHTMDPDIVGGSGEIEQAAEALRPFHEEFPGISVTLGNHDARIARKVFAAGIPARVLVSLSETLGVPTWDLKPDVEIDGVYYVHDATGGINGAARTALKLQMPVVAGHVHSAFGVVHQTNVLWGMQVGTLVNPADPRFAYARNAKATTRLGCGVVIDGHTPIAIPLTAYTERR